MSKTHIVAIIDAEFARREAEAKKKDEEDRRKRCERKVGQTALVARFRKPEAWAMASIRGPGSIAQAISPNWREVTWGQNQRALIS
jgi:hypothetical protein